MIQKLGKLVFPLVAVVVAAIVCQAQSLKTHHVRDAVRNGQAQMTGRLPGNQVLQLDLVLQLSDKAGLESFLKDLYDPTNPSYRHFLTPQEFTARFGPTQDDYDSVVRFAKTYGFQVVGGSRDAMDVQVKGTVSTIETAFHVNMRTYRHPTENRAFYGPDNEPTLDLPFSLWHISGLDNYSIPHPMLENKDVYAQAHGIDASKVVSHATTGSGPSASFLGSDMRVAYYGGSLTGAGQSLGLFEYYGTDIADLQTYFKNVGQPDLSGIVSLVSTDGTSTACLKKSGCDDTEQTLDMTQALGMAPGLSSLVVYVGSTDTAMIGAMTTHNPLPGTIGCSWGWTPVDPTSLDPYFQKMAAQGQNFFVASGDSSTWTSSKYPWPAEDGNVVTVGGTDLVTTGAGGAWSSETAWVDSGGGISPHKVAIPSYQKLAGVINSTNKGSTTYRNGPDVSANANFSFYVCADQTTCTANSYGGTSFAAPMWAAYIALVNQQLAANSQPTIGFINPTIYAQNVSGGALSGAYGSNFHDITSGTSGSYSAVNGYDLVTGWGSPSTGLFAALTGAVPTSGFTLSASAVSILQGTTGASTVTSTPFGGYSSTIQLSVSGLPSGVSVLSYGTNPFGPSGSTTINFSAAANATPGTYSVTVTGTGTADGTLQTTTVSLTVTALPLIFSIGANPTTLTVSRGSSGTTTISTAVSQGSISSITLSASGQKSGTSASFSPSSISGGTGSSTLKFTVSNRATTGTFTITVKGTGGTVSKTVGVTLTVK
jgi:kumamolisin